MTERDFKGVWIPAEIWLDKRLSALDKVILFEIDSLTKENSDCYASNEHLAEFSLCSERKVSEAISKLIEIGYVELVSYDGRKRFLRSRLAKSASQSSKICESDSQKVRESNTNKKTNENHSVSNETLIERFERFWKVYPVKSGKGEARKSWLKIKPSDELTATMIHAVERQRREDSRWLEGYIPNPSTWLNQRRWEDEPVPDLKKPQQKSAKSADIRDGMDMSFLNGTVL